MAEAATQTAPTYAERYIDADGFHIRYLEAGQGEAVVLLHAAGGMAPSALNDKLTEEYRVIAVEMPGFGQSPTNERSKSAEDMARTMMQAVAALGIEQYNLIGTSLGGKVALWQAVLDQEHIEALVLLAPASIRPDNWALPNPQQNPEAFYAHPEKMPARPAMDPAVMAKQAKLVTTLLGPNREPELESKLGDLQVPTLVLFGTRDGVAPPEMGRYYREKIPNCNLVFIYDAAHAMVAERPEAVTGVILDYLERHETFIVSRANTMINP